MKSRVFKPVHDDAKCVRCRNCFNYCPESAVSWEGKPEINLKKCTGCLICVNECETKALSAVKEK